MKKRHVCMQSHNPFKTPARLSRFHPRAKKSPMHSFLTGVHKELSTRHARVCLEYKRRTSRGATTPSGLPH
eukprot:1161424-Pelagomonas_calceolata.AAC.5